MSRFRPNPPAVHIARRLRGCSRAVLLAATIGCFCGRASGQVSGDPAAFEGVGIEEHLGEQIPLDLTFRDEQGQSVALKDFFHQGKPVVLVLAYYECPMLCTLVLNGLTNAVQQVDLQPGEQFQILTVSIDPEETPDLAAAKQKRYLGSLKRQVDSSSWRFLVGNAEEIEQLADALGFQYKYLPDRDEFAHPSVIHLLTEDGKISRYLYGIEFRPKDVKLGLLEASDGKIGSITDRVLLYCFHYDPAGKKYRAVATNVMRVAGAATVVVMAVILAGLWYWDLHRRGTRQEDNNSSKAH